MPALHASTSQSAVTQFSLATASLVMSKSKPFLSRRSSALLPALLLLPLFASVMYMALRLASPARPGIPTVFILSNRRSGTHLTMDILAEILPPPLRLVKTNHVYLTNSTAKDDTEQGLNCRCLNFLRRSGKLIHAHRDVRDVIISSFYYMHSYNASLVRGLTMEQYLANDKGARNYIIAKWVNTTTPFFAQPDILQLYFTDSISGFAHVHDKISAFLGYEHSRTLGIDPRKIKSASSAVFRHRGKGDHGYKLEMSSGLQSGILQIARDMEHWKRDNMVHCPPQTSQREKMREEWRDRQEESFWVGDDKGHGMLIPAYCPEIMKTGKVVELQPSSEVERPV